MDEHFPEAVVSGYETLIAELDLPDVHDRHVLAAAIHGCASVIVTLNLRDFPADRLAPHGLEAQHPDDFIGGLLESSASTQRTPNTGKDPPPSVSPRIAANHKPCVAKRPSLSRASSRPSTGCGSSRTRGTRPGQIGRLLRREGLYSASTSCSIPSGDTSRAGWSPTGRTPRWPQGSSSSPASTRASNPGAHPAFGPPRADDQQLHRPTVRRPRGHSLPHRPEVNDDNPFSEPQFKPLKYHPGFLPLPGYHRRDQLLPVLLPLLQHRAPPCRDRNAHTG